MNMSSTAETIKLFMESWLPLQRLLPLLSASTLDKLLKPYTAIERGAADVPITPINRLPPELLCEIFSVELSDTPSSEQTYDRRVPRRTLSLSKRLDPVVMGEVCQQWRAVTLSHPLLWANFRVLCDLRTDTLGLLSTWLKRSGNVPLSIKFLESFPDPPSKWPHEEWVYPPQNPVTPKMMAMLTAHAHRWKSIDFEFYTQISPVLADMPPDSFLTLESAKLRSRRATNARFDGHTQLVKVWNAFHASPKFHRADYETEYVHTQPRDVPWSRLTFVDLTILKEELLKFLAAAENLEELRYTDPLTCYVSVFFPERPIAPLPPIVLPALRRLHLKTTIPPDEIFKALTLPRLNSVHIHQHYIWIARPDPSAFTDLLTRSQCSLKSFSYKAHGSPVGEEVLNDIIVSPSMSSVVDLTMEGRLTDSFAKVMRPESGKQLTLPNLESLTLIRPANPPGVLGDMIVSRVQENPTLQSVILEYWPRHEADRMAFSKLREQGIYVKD